MTSPVELLYILGPGHCGSTLLNLCLDKHSSVIGVSEIITLNRKIPGWSGEENILESNFWSKVDSLMQDKHGIALSEIPFSLKAKVSKLPHNLFLQYNKFALEAILEIAGKSIVADASKNPKRLDILLRSPLFKVRVIYLVRDGRAIVHAYRRKYGNWLVGWFNLMRTENAANNLKSQYGSDNWLTIRYEDMVTNLEDTLKTVCKFSGIKFESNMLLPDTKNFNGLGGNRLRKYPIKDIILDNAWKTQMSVLMRSFTTFTVAKFNKRHGYTD
jgi:hypothetical protein